jgi:hypothetical protein
MTDFSGMNIEAIEIDGKVIADVQSDEVLVSDAGSGTDLVGNLYYQGFDRAILRADQFSAEFFDLRSGLAGEILQKFSSYRMRLAIVGDFSRYSSKALRDFIRESNSLGHVVFADSEENALLAMMKD